MRLDAALVARGLARSRGQAKDLVAAGAVLVSGTIARKVSAEVPPDVPIEVTDSDPSVSRAAHKLRGALDDIGLGVPPRVLDAGASTGGFTQVLLERGAAVVYAVDVGHDQLDPTLRSDPRVVVREGLNVRELAVEDVGGEAVDLVVADLSFISLRLVLERLLSCVRPDGEALLLVKPQFEVGRRALDSRGVVRDEAARLAAVAGVVEAGVALGWRPSWQGRSRLPGPAGNVEFFVHLRGPSHPASPGSGNGGTAH